MANKAPGLSPLEDEVMKVIWSRGPSTAEEVRTALSDDRELKESTVRTLLRRMEQKGYVKHGVEGRTYIYSEVIAPHKAAAEAVRQIVNRFCGGSVEALLVGMVNDDMLERRDLVELAEKLGEENEDEK